MTNSFPLPINFHFCMAPMVGLSHVALRNVVRSYLPEGAVTIWPSEMLNSRRLPFEIMGQVPETKKHESENFWVPQILGNEEESIALSLKKLEDYGAHGIDINMGCPVKKALRHNYGVALMGDPLYAAEVVRLTVKHTQLPVSVKLRAPPEGRFEEFFPFVEGIERAGAKWIAFHPRTPEQKRRGIADWSQIADLKRHLNIPVIGNGDVQTAEDAMRMKSETSCDVVMIGRALAGRPWLLWQIGEALGLPNPEGKTGRAPSTPEEEGREFGLMLTVLWNQMENEFQLNYAMRKFQFFLRTSTVWLEFGHTLMARLSNAKDSDQIRETIFQFFSQPQRMMKRTELRY